MTRLIDADALRKEIRELPNENTDYIYLDLVDREVVQALISEAPTVKQPHGEWIPVAERLPEDERPVLIYAWNVHHVVARYGQFRTQDGGYKNAWVTADAWFGNTEIKHKVIAWMPLPEPYKEGDSNAQH